MGEETVRGYREGDEKAISELLNKVFNGWPRLDSACSSEEYWMWKYRPHGAEPRFVVIAENDGEVVGTMHSMPFVFKLFDGSCNMNIGSDLAVHPEHRKSGVWAKMEEMMIRLLSEGGVDYQYAGSCNPIVVKRLDRTPDVMRVPVPLVNLVKVRDINEQLNRMPVGNKLITRLGYESMKTVTRITSTLKNGAGEKSPFKVRLVERFDESLEKFLAEALKDYDFIQKRSIDYLNWRYCDPRLGAYTLFVAEDDDGVQGYCVTRVNRYNPDYGVGYVVDLLASPGRLDVADGLFGTAVDALDAEGVNIVNYLVVQGHPYEAVGNRRGFVNSMIKPQFFYRCFQGKDDLEALSDTPHSRLFFSWGDHDSLPVSHPS